MIVQAVKKQTVDVEIDPVSVLHDLQENWKLVVCRVPKDADIFDCGNWKTYERIGHNHDWEFYRVATDREKEQYAAFEMVTDITRDLED